MLPIRNFYQSLFTATLLSCSTHTKESLLSITIPATQTNQVAFHMHVLKTARFRQVLRSTP